MPKLSFLVVAVVVSSCLQPGEVRDAVDASVPGEAPAADVPFDPCAWNGRGGYCYADMGYVFLGDGCGSVCAPSGSTNGTVFTTSEECNATCSCRAEKLVAPDSPTNPFVIGGACDALWAIADGGEPLWPGCRPATDFGTPADQACPLEISGRIDRHGLATICAVSAQSRVRQVLCVVSSK